MNERGDGALESPRAGAEPDLVVDSATGVEVALPVAGPGARSYAFVIDWHIRVIVAIAWYVVAALIFNGAWSLGAPIEPSAGWFGLVLLPAAAIYLLYHPVLEIAMRGRTPGKRMAGVRIVTHDGALPAMPAHLIRSVFRLIDSLPVFYGIGLVTAVVTKNHVRIGDLAAGTLLVYERGEELVLEHVSATALGSRLDAHTAELVNELLARWTLLDGAVRVRLARTLLTKLHVADSDALDDAGLRARLELLASGEKAP
jgi:uncharacterized RDD family membrane protein YckC